jgi:hypothetical protein
MRDVTGVELAETLLEIGSSAKTGVLRVSAAGRLRMAFFEEGALVYLVSDVPEENLAACFARAGRFESAAERLALFQLEREVTRKKTLVTLVLERGLRDQEALRSWLVDYAFEVFGRVFESHDASAKLTAGIRAEHPLSYRVEAPELILEAARRMADDDRIHEAVGPLNRQTQPVAGAAERLQSLPLSFYEGLVASRVTGPMRLEEIVVIAGIPEMDALRAILALRLVGIFGPFTEVKAVSDSGRLAIRQAALDSGYAVDASAINLAAAMLDEGGGVPITMGELEGTATYTPPAPRQRGHSAPLQYPPPRPRGDTGRLKLLASAYIQMGEAEAAAGNYGAAAQCFESALAQKPNDLGTMVAYARVLAKRPAGVPAAVRMLEQAAEAHPKSAAPLIEVAKLHRDAGRMEEAEEVLKEARRLDPQNAQVRQLLENLHKGGGLLSRFGFHADKKPSGIRPPEKRPSGARPPQARPAAASAAAPPPPPAGDGELRLRCRYCGRQVQGEARVCRSCGATL